MRLACVVSSDRYLADSVKVASILPHVWLRSIDDQALQTSLQSVVAGASVSGKLRPGESPDGEAQHLVMFLVETEQESAAQCLLELAQAKARVADGVARLGVRHGRLFCLTIARSFIVGHKPVETRQSITRFEPGVAQALRHGS